MTSVYLASPIDQLDGVSLKEERGRIKALLNAGGAAVFDPAAGWSGGHGGPNACVAVDRFAIDTCDGLLAVLPDGVASVGVPTEIEYARAAGKPVAVVAGVRQGASIFLREGGAHVELTNTLGETRAVVWLLNTMGQSPLLSQGSVPLFSSREGLRFTGDGVDGAEDVDLTVEGLDALVQGVGQFQRDKGWDAEPRSLGDLIALAHSELSEALEEHRSGRDDAEVYYTHAEGCNNTGHGPGRPCADGLDRTGEQVEVHAIGYMKPEGVPIELADAVIRIAGIAALHGWSLGRAVRIKMRYNATRAYRHGGKKI